MASFRSPAIAGELNEASLFVPPVEKAAVVYKCEKSLNDEMAAVFCNLDVHAFSSGRYTLIVRVTDTKRVETLTSERDVDIVVP